MIPNYTYTPSPDFIGQLAFDHIETYSFQRGDEYKKQQKIFEREYDKLKSQKESFEHLTLEQEERIVFLEKLCGFTQCLINDKKEFHFSSQLINKFSVEDVRVDALRDILMTEVEDVPYKLCAPTYRDAIVFYNSDHDIVAVLNVCLSCQYMETAMFKHVNGDWKTYDLLKRFFIDIGHEVENPEFFPLADLEKLRSKYKK